MNDIVLITIAILLPIAPAYILYKALPPEKESTVSGPFKGLMIKLSGAFAGYFLLVLTILGFLGTRPITTDARYEVWHVRGKLNWDQGGAPADIKRAQMRLMPAAQDVGGDGSFIIRVAPEVVGPNRLQFPTLLIEHPDFQPININLNDTPATFGQQVGTVSRDVVAKLISVTGPIELKKTNQLPPYAPSGASPQQAALTPREVSQ